jgi:hypothetical protein
MKGAGAGAVGSILRFIAQCHAKVSRESSRCGWGLWKEGAESVACRSSVQCHAKVGAQWVMEERNLVCMHLNPFR